MKTPENFTIRSYGKSELAQLYIPDIAPDSAAKSIKRWIEKYPGLKKKLKTAGLRPTDKRYTPLQVRLIVEAFGEP